MNNKNYISARDIPENAKLNYEIAKELRKHISLSCQCSTLGRSKKQLTLLFARRRMAEAQRNRRCVARGDTMRVFVVSQAMLERYNKFTRNCSSRCETAEAVETTAKSELSRSNKDSLATWFLWSSQRMTKMYVLLSIITLLPTLAQAETCTPTPDCKSLGYTETSCENGGVKCPWNTSLMYCPKCKNSCTLKSNCEIGDVLYSDKKCYTCPNAYTLPGLPPIGVVFDTGMAVARKDISSSMDWSTGNSQCNSYSASGVTGWHLPTKDELLTIHGNISSVQDGLTKAGGTQFSSAWYWSSSYYYDPNGTSYWIVNPVSGGTSHWYYGNFTYVRPVLAF